MVKFKFLGSNISNLRHAMKPGAYYYILVKRHYDYTQL